MTLLTRDQILSADDLLTVDVAVPEWGGTVRVRALTGAERDRLEASLLGKDGTASAAKILNFRARVCALTMIGEDGERLFGDAQVAELGRKSAAALARVAEAAQKLSGISDDDVDELVGE
ncbi:hypothetical protein ACFQE5_23120 [Pseudonocardia hispaniensis]|uniref:Tail assembly chaperone n=1 Tax=Pseudonocardia hispaniensis TaxID=904933 RepID=A0ABW1J896_9PSEU